MNTLIKIRNLIYYLIFAAIFWYVVYFFIIGDYNFLAWKTISKITFILINILSAIIGFFSHDDNKYETD
jgi:hypothetical protein